MVLPSADAAAVYDVLIIGGGAAGMLAALGARAAEGLHTPTGSADSADAGPVPADADAVPSAAAAATVAATPARVLILEKMAKAGRKISASGGGRCNFSNTLSARQFVDKFGRGGKFLGAALKALPNRALIEMLARHGVTGEVEQGYRLYTTSGRGEDVTEAILDELTAAQVPLLTGRPVLEVRQVDGLFELTLGRDAMDRPPQSAAEAVASAAQGTPPSPHDRRPLERLRAKALVIAVGGASYPKLGSTGDGYTWARQFGHTVTPLQAALVGVRVAELALCKELQGLRMDNCVARLIRGKQAHKPVASEPGDLLFAHFGVTGPALLDLSLSVVAELAKGNGPSDEPLMLSLDLAPEMTAEALRARLDEQLKSLGAADRRYAFETRLPKRLRETMWRVADPNSAPPPEPDTAGSPEATGHSDGTPAREASPAEIVARVRSGMAARGDRYGDRRPQAEHPASRTPAAVRDAFVRCIKHWRFTVTGTRELEVGEVTDGGVSLDEVDKQTMMSKKQPGLFFCGEILDLTGRCGGFNLQAAWSTGYLAGQKALHFARGTLAPE